MDIIIAGAGIVGCAIAHELVRRGARVRLVDPRGTGQGATRASAGILAPYIEGHAEALFALGMCSLEAYDAFIERVRADTTHPIEYERTGTLQVAHDAAGMLELQALAGDLLERDVPCQLMDDAEAMRLEPALSGNVRAALLVSRHGYVAAQALTAALVNAAVRRGATFVRDRVLAVHSRPGGAQVVTTTERMDGDAVVVAAGSWSAQIAPAPAGAPVVKPIRGQLLHLRLPAPPLSRVVWGSRCYLVPWHDGSVLVGATVEDVGFDERPTAGGVHMLLESAMELVPALRAAAFEEVRVGLRPWTADELPAIGRSSMMPHLFHATGHYRNGVLLAPLTATLVADLVLNGRERPELAAVRPDRFGL